MPDRHDGFIKTALIFPFTETARARGVDIAAALETHDLTPGDLRNPNRSVHAEVIYGLTNTLATLCHDPHFGYNVAAAFDLRQWHPIKDAFAHARTVGDFYTRFLSAVPQQASSVRHSLTITAEHATYSVDRIVQTSNPPEQVEGFGIGLHLRLLNLVLGPQWNGTEVTLLTPYSNAVPELPFGARVSSRNISGLALRFPNTWLVLPFSRRDGQTTPRPADTDIDLSIIEALRNVARPHLEDRTLGLQDYAEHLGMPPARLSAALRLQDTTLSREIKKLRIDVAAIFLTETALSVADIGNRLGYPDQSHFARFFRSQTGMSPLRYRRDSAAK